MPTVQNKLADVVLATIRARRDDGKRALQPAPVRAGESISLRPAEFSDFEAVAELGRRLGQGPDSQENWKRLWIDNPAVQSGRAVGRIGWVLESGGTVVGFFGTIPLLCEFEGSTLLAAATCRFAVDAQFRSSSHLLVSSFLRQKDVDLFLNTTATPAAGKMMLALKAAPVPQKDYGTVLFWVLDSRHFVQAVLRKLGAHPPLIGIGGIAGSIVQRAEAAVRGRFPKPVANGCDITEFSIGQLPSDFDSFCAEQSQKRIRLLGKRSAAILQWHFAPPASKKVCRIYIGRKDGGIVGYAITRQEFDPETQLQRSSIADLLVADDNPTVVRELVAAAYAAAKRTGSHVLEMLGFPTSIREPLLQWQPYTRQYPSCPYFFKARDRGLHERLSNADLWYGCPFDGDATLWP